jgi:hypothetical protein
MVVEDQFIDLYLFIHIYILGLCQFSLLNITVEKKKKPPTPMSHKIGSEQEVYTLQAKNMFKESVCGQ